MPHARAQRGHRCRETIGVAAPTEVARETDPARFSEPHLAVDPSNPDRLLAAVIVPLTMNGPLQQQLRAGRCAVFASRDGGRSWTRHDFPYEQCGDPQVAVLPDGQAIVAMLGATRAFGRTGPTG